MASCVSSGISATTFRAKAAEMRAWRPQSAPSNRDRLELYALHKQAVSGDAPPSPPPQSGDGGPKMPGLSTAEKSKTQAWTSKRGLTQGEAMNSYVAECDRQMRVYGSGPLLSSACSSTTISPGTPTNTPALDRRGSESGSASVLLTPRGLAAVPLLCAAAAEGRPAYLARLRATPTSDGWWMKQEPLCADPGTAFATPENLLLLFASKLEYLSLSLNENNTLPLLPTAIQSFLWPLHNSLLAIWILLIFICTTIASAFITSKTILFGSRNTGIPLPTIFSEEILPAERTASSLCQTNQSISIRLTGLALMPLVTICDVAKAAVDSADIFIGSAGYVFLVAVTWWYWLCVLPWLAFWGVCAAVMMGFCFALIEVAGV